MCGLAGVLEPAGLEAGAEVRLRRMGSRLRHRGPDDAGIWLDADAGIGLAHQRLAIIDLSAAGHQPMISPSGRYVIAYNGEIYNFGDIRRELGGSDARWRGGSDTEVLLAAIEEWGLDAALHRAVGMFAFALWDRTDRTLRLVRDRLGVKPLYVAALETGVAFASELKGLWSHPRFGAEIDAHALNLMLRHGFVPAPHCIYRDAWKIAPGEILEIPSGAARSPASWRRRAYWSLAEVAVRGTGDRIEDEIEATERFEEAFRRAVACRLVADVPLGALLSGGIDSTAVVAGMREAGAGHVRTFTIGFDSPDHDETTDAGRVARHLETDHTEHRLSDGDLLGVVPELSRLYDEPFADPSQIPTSLVFRLASEHATVALTGDGGDELFAGYTRHALGPSVWTRMAPVPLMLRKAIAAPLRLISPRVWSSAYRALEPLLPPSKRQRLPAEKLRKLARILDARSFDELHARLASTGEAAQGCLHHELREAMSGVLDHPGASGGADVRDLVERMLLADTVGELPDQMLTKVDRASMGASVEARSPFLDHRLAELSWRLPPHLKLRDGEGKWIVRRAVERRVPSELLARPKMGFAVPLARWLRGPLRGWAEALLDPDRLRREHRFDARALGRLWQEHQAGRRDHESALWNVLMFQAWHEHQAAERATAAIEAP